MKWYLKLLLGIFPSGRKLIRKYQQLCKESNVSNLAAIQTPIENNNSDGINKDDYAIVFKP